MISLYGALLHVLWSHDMPANNHLSSSNLRVSLCGESCLGIVGFSVMWYLSKLSLNLSVSTNRLFISIYLTKSYIIFVMSFSQYQCTFIVLCIALFYNKKIILHLVRNKWHFRGSFLVLIKWHFTKIEYHWTNRRFSP